ncbi:MAG: hypothetical protein U0Q22_13545 [Acidimicrobiales bacterium]
MLALMWLAVLQRRRSRTTDVVLAMAWIFYAGVVGWNTLLLIRCQALGLAAVGHFAHFRLVSYPGRPYGAGPWTNPGDETMRVTPTEPIADAASPVDVAAHPIPLRRWVMAVAILVLNLADVVITKAILRLGAPRPTRSWRRSWITPPTRSCSRR